MMLRNAYALLEELAFLEEKLRHLKEALGPAYDGKEELLVELVAKACERSRREGH